MSNKNEQVVETGDIALFRRTSGGCGGGISSQYYSNGRATLDHQNVVVGFPVEGEPDHFYVMAIGSSDATVVARRDELTVVEKSAAVLYSGAELNQLLSAVAELSYVFPNHTAQVTFNGNLPDYTDAMVIERQLPVIRKLLARYPAFENTQAARKQTRRAIALEMAQEELADKLLASDSAQRKVNKLQKKIAANKGGF